MNCLSCSCSYIWTVEAVTVQVLREICMSRWEVSRDVLWRWQVYSGFTSTWEALSLSTVISFFLFILSSTVPSLGHGEVWVLRIFWALWIKVRSCSRQKSWSGRMAIYCRPCFVSLLYLYCWFLNLTTIQSNLCVISTSSYNFEAQSTLPDVFIYRPSSPRREPRCNALICSFDHWACVWYGVDHHLQSKHYHMLLKVGITIKQPQVTTLLGSFGWRKIGHMGRFCPYLCRAKIPIFEVLVHHFELCM